MKITPAVVVAGLWACFSGALSAQNLIYSVGDADHNGVIDPGSIGYNASLAYIDSFDVVYNAGTERFDFSVEFTGNAEVPDGFWLVVSDGPNPKNHLDEYAIFYFDASSGSGIVTSYVYSGLNNALSWDDPGEKLVSSLNGSTITTGVTTGGNTAAFSFSADVSGINDASAWPYGLGSDWDGAAIGDEIGVWFHPFVTGDDPAYGKDGFLKSLDIEQQGWFDTNYQPTIPEPATAFLGLLGGLGLLFLRRRAAK